ncbi:MULTISPECIES: thymidylate synthase [unclassified Burkholderia]|uniref:thymidylate synthase n=1 Tax=unclassified Burkholderia TaxID=2613784 RepID=UPI002AB1D51C|nr:MULTISPECIES: thymidylate synthase [unclassified Burkholderia]
MYLSAETLDDLLIKVYKRLLRRRGANEISPRKGAATEIFGVLLQITNPRARLSRTELKSTFYSCVGEFLWYLSGTNKLDFIEYYIRDYVKSSDDKKTIYGAYGPRLFSLNGIDQVDNVIKLLQAWPNSRRAVIQLFRAEDLATDLETSLKDIPCTCTLQFSVRRGQLQMLTMMRSNDAYKGLPHDVFAFTMLQEIMARKLGVEVGTYRHTVGSFHLYAEDAEKAAEYLEEGVQARVPMPAMPHGDQQTSIEMLLKAEENIRQGRRPRIAQMHPYWADLARLLQVYRYSIKPTKAHRERIERVKSQMHSDVYDMYIEKRERRKAAPFPVEQPLFPLSEFDSPTPDACSK